jgi:hypothetical protein
VRQQGKLKVKEILGNGVDLGLRLVDFFPDLTDVVKDTLLNRFEVIIM